MQGGQWCGYLRVDLGLVASAAANELGGLVRLVGAQRIAVGRRGNLAKALRGEVACITTNGVFR